MIRNVICIIALLVSNALSVGWTVSPTPEEKELAARWFDARLAGMVAADRTAGVDFVDPYLETIQNHNGPVTRNTGYFGEPLKIAQRTFESGLFCQAPSRVIIHSPYPIESVAGWVGLYNTQSTQYGTGSVEFVIRAGEKEYYRSEVKRLERAATQFSVSPGNIRDLELILEDAGDGNACDLGVWGDLVIKSQNDGEYKVGDLSMGKGPSPLPTNPPWSIRIDGKPAAFDSERWRIERSLSLQANGSRIIDVTASDNSSGLKVYCKARQYGDYPVIEWTLYLENTGQKSSPILEDIRPLNAVFQRTPDTIPFWEHGSDRRHEFKLHYGVGSHRGPLSYEPEEEWLDPKANRSFSPLGGLPCYQAWPYFNVHGPDNGLMMAIGWPGQWYASFERDDGIGLRIEAGQEITHLSLNPGERIRTPRVVLLYYQGNWLRGQHLWRRWMRDHNSPRPGGRPPEPIHSAWSCQLFDHMVNATEEIQNFFIDRYVEEDLDLDNWWMDAGWYKCGGSWPNVGTWEVNRKNFPNGIKAVSDHAEKYGITTMLWFNPEQVTPETWLAENHQPWLRGDPDSIQMLDLGNPEALDWAINHVDRVLKEEGIDIYRQDYCSSCLGYWRQGDEENRQGISEIRHVEGYLSFWDELLRRNPDLLIDSCCGGGCRNEIETMARSVPFWIDDSIGGTPSTMEGRIYGTALWLPWFGTMVGTDTYSFRSRMTPLIMSGGLDMRDQEQDLSNYRRLVRQWRRISPLYEGDFYPLTPYSRSEETWMAWQYHCEERREGFIQVMGRTRSWITEACFKPRGLDPESHYRITDFDHEEEPWEVAGDVLLENGLQVRIVEKPAAKVYLYETIDGQE